MMTEDKKSLILKIAKLIGCKKDGDFISLPGGSINSKAAYYVNLDTGEVKELIEKNNEENRRGVEKRLDDLEKIVAELIKAVLYTSFSDYKSYADLCQQHNQSFITVKTWFDQRNAERVYEK